jgi:hypothetical protein
VAGAGSSWNLLALPIQGSYVRMHPNMGESLVSLHSRLCEVHYRNNSSITEGSNANHVSFTMLTTMCFPFITYNIYHRYGWCHLKVRPIMVMSNLFSMSHIVIK